MIVEHNFYIGLRDIGKDNLLSNKGILAALEDAGCMHSEKAGIGITNINETKRSWIILSWRVKVFFRIMWRILSFFILLIISQWVLLRLISSLLYVIIHLRKVGFRTLTYI